MPDIVELIEKDHREVEGLFAEFKQTPTKDLAMRICTELDKHSVGEEQTIYPAMQGVDGTLVKEAEQEHAEAKQLIGRIKNTSDDQHLTELMTELEGAITHHVQEEESEFLPKAKQALDGSKLTQLGEEFQSVKQTVRS